MHYQILINFGEQTDAEYVIPGTAAHESSSTSLAISNKCTHSSCKGFRNYWLLKAINRSKENTAAFIGKHLSQSATVQ